MEKTVLFIVFCSKDRSSNKKKFTGFAKTITVLSRSSYLILDSSANVVHQGIYEECKVCLLCLGHLLIGMYERNERFHR